MPEPNEPRRVLSVSELNRVVRQLLETHLPLLWVEGEISNLVRPASGHWYLTLKDENAQVRCAMFRNTNMRVRFAPSNGDKVLVRCRAGLYEERGEYQLIIEHMEEAGFGALQRRFEELKQKLQAEGLFDAERKRPLPASINHIGIVTSKTGAAIHDLLTVLNRRFPTIRVTLYPVAVQGKEAALQIVEAIENANLHGACDVLVVGRGGGSLEDLWPFNEEAVARAIVASRIPVVSAVGHEVDYTIADFVADLRAATPSAAAEMLSPDGAKLLARLKGYEALLATAVHRTLARLAQRADHLERRLRHPGQQLRDQIRHLAQLRFRLRRCTEQLILNKSRHLSALSRQLGAISPRPALRRARQNLNSQVKMLCRSAQRKVAINSDQLRQRMQLLDAVSPLNTLGRGYAIVQNADGAVIRRTDDVRKGDQITARLVDGRLDCTVEETLKQSESSG